MFHCKNVIYFRKILIEHGGSAIDAAIATLFCEGVTVCQSMGLGGGFVATMYNKESGKIDTLIARERAPILSKPVKTILQKRLEKFCSIRFFFILRNPNK